MIGADALARLPPCRSTRSGERRRPRVTGTGSPRSDANSSPTGSSGSTTTPRPISCSTCSTPTDPKAFRRSARGTYSASFYELEDVPDDVLRTSYPNLVRTLANVVVLHVPGEGVWFTTMERGTYKISDDPAEVFERLAPLAKSKLVIDNEFVSDLEPELWDGDEITADIAAAGKRMQGARSAAGALPGARVSERARSAPRDAPVPGRRALLRESVRPQGRNSVLDERERRRQVSARGSRPRHPARHGL